MKVFISTAPFAEIDQTPLAILNRAGVAYTINPTQRRLTSAELCEFIYDVDGIIAGTEEISASVMQRAPNLKIISRVGIGLDSVDLNAARRKGVMVTYTPDAPSPAVAELTIGLILSSLRGIHNSHRDLCAGKWKRYFGTRLTESSIGIIGVGRIGGRVVEALKGMGCHRILVNDLDDRVKETNLEGCEWVEKKEIYRNADVISLHVPLLAIVEG